MQLLNLSIDRIIIHQIYRRDNDGKKVSPTQSHQFTRFDESAMEEFRARVTDALGEGSKAVQMQIISQDKQDTPILVDSIINQSDEEFAVSSFDFAKKLTDAQQKRNIPGGIVVVFTGTQGYPARKLLGVMKAEIHSAYEKQVHPQTKEISLKFVEEVLLTPGTRLYKTAAFFEKAIDGAGDDLNQKYTVMVSDYQIGKADGKAAAQYFYQDFLGCGYPETSARTTKHFYDAAINFIDDMELEAEKKSDLFNALTTYLKVSTSSTISSEEFAASYFDRATQDDFKTYMKDSGLPTAAFTKDIEHIQTKLKFRRVNFSKNVKIIAPSDVFKDYIVIESIDGEPDEAGTPQKWTKVTVKDRITQQE